MKKLILCFLVIGAVHPSFSQSAGRSYGVIENRFTKEELNHSDSVAFEKLAERKLVLLMDYTRLYYSDRGRKTRSHIRERVSELFSSPGDTSLDEKVDSRHIIEHMNHILDTVTIANQYKYIKWEKGSRYFGTLRLGDDQFVVKVFLKKTSKNFGNNSSKVWQLYLFDPHFKLEDKED